MKENHWVSSLWVIAIALAGTACSELLPGIIDPGDGCSNTCVGNTTMIIGCDNRVVKPEDLDGASAEPWRFTGRLHRPAANGGGFCSGTLIADRFVLTAAHCLQNLGNTPIGFALAQEAQHVSQRPFGTFGVRRVFIPSSYQDSNDELDQAFDYGIAELWEPVEGVTPANWGHVDWDILRNKPVFTAGYPGSQPDNGVLGRPWITEGAYQAVQPYAWLDGGEAGLLYTNLDGTGGQSGSPVYSLLLPSQHDAGGIIRLVSGVLIGSPAAACQQDQVWAARLTPGAVQHIENVLDPATIDFFWEVINIPSSPSAGPGEPWP